MNRASRIAAPIVREAFHKKMPLDVNAQSVARAVRKALTDFRYPDGSEIHPCVIEEWANESHRRIGMHKMWRERKRVLGLKRRPGRKEIDRAAKRIEKQRLIVGDTLTFKRSTSVSAGLAFLLAARRIFQSAGRNQ